MNAQVDTEYRFDLASGFLAEAEQDFTLKRWRSCVDNSQLSLENSGKGALMLFGLSPKTHDPGRDLAMVLRAAEMSDELRRRAEALVVDLLALGPSEHFLTDYGDEAAHILPWNLFTQESAEKALAAARNGLSRAKELLRAWQHAADAGQ
jgi:HEPN domain-containing protein